jgi:hypothetical protein
MSLPDFRIYSPSYKRPTTCKSHKLFPRELFYYAVEEKEVEDYERAGHRVISLPKRSPQNIASARNCILRQRETKKILVVDDDLTNIRWRLHRKRVDLDISEIMKVLINGFEMAEDIQCGLWGINLNTDPLAYQQNNPFHFSAPVLGTFSAILDDGLWYDESITLKEDYDYFIQQMQKYRRVLRFNYLHYECDHLAMAGGCQEYRTEEEEERQKLMFQKKWGSKIVKHNPRKDRDTTNMIVKVGL